MPQYDEIEIEDMTYDPDTLTYSYPCPCGDRFKVTLEDLWEGDDIADCQSCTLFIQVIYEKENLPPLPGRDDDDEDGDERNTTNNKEDDKPEDSNKKEETTDDKDKLSTEKDDIALGVGKISLSTSGEGGNLQSNNPAVAA
mmetsp:Transcript_11434/g.18388  ORF Transcript_11434/g.18388 Transcript_11434/m.18388 type:complete len:141 (-) Transcript_11434:252-674(-)